MVGEYSVVYNTTSSGLTNLASQTGSVGTVFGVALLLGLIMGVFYSAHSWNMKGWLYRLVRFLTYTIGENFLYGSTTIAFGYSVYWIGSELGKYSESNPELFFDILRFGIVAITAITVIVMIGYITKPIYNLAWNYACGNRKKVTVKA